jgi:hypothetical protein
MLDKNDIDYCLYNNIDLIIEIGKLDNNNINWLKIIPTKYATYLSLMKEINDIINLLSNFYIKLEGKKNNIIYFSKIIHQPNS